jgi:hypothetical protein
MLDVPPPLRDKNPHLHPTLEAICLRCLEKKPEDRFPNMEALEFALEQPYRYMQRRNQELGRAGEAEKYRSRQARTITVQRDGSGKSLITMRRMYTPRAAALAAVGVALLLVAMAIGLRKPAAAPPPPVVAAVVAPSPRPVQALIVSAPAGASVRDGERWLGVTPLTVSRPKGTTLTLEVTLADFQPARRELLLSADQELDFMLKPVEIIRVPTPPPRRAKTKHDPQPPPAAEAQPVEPEGLIPTEL